MGDISFIGSTMRRQKRNIRIVLQYDGSNYHGWQIQPNALTIQEVLQKALSQITQENNKVIAAARTDAGVHAILQVAHFHTNSPRNPDEILNGLNSLLPPDIRVLKSEEIEMSFHSRFRAIGKRYAYFIWNHPLASAFAYKYSWWIPQRLDLEAMEEGSGYFIGEHDFSSFKASGCKSRNTVREIRQCSWERFGPWLVFRVEGTAFLRHMVRAMVGTLVEVGLGKRAPGSILELLSAGDRRRSGPTAPARGLFLMEVMYPPPWSLQGWSAWEGMSSTETGLGHIGSYREYPESSKKTFHEWGWKSPWEVLMTWRCLW
jgi:tRNA pseudouridine38-40 synthase